LRAHGLTKVGPGGGTPGENITVHRVPLAGLEAFITDRRALGDAIDVKILMLLGPSILSSSRA
jgi:ADP-ribose pyrophosphatase